MEKVSAAGKAKMVLRYRRVDRMEWEQTIPAVRRGLSMAAILSED
jgi:hypothetical protein